MQTTMTLFSPLIQDILVGVVSILAIYATTALNRVRQRYGVEVDEKSNNRIREAIENGIELAQSNIPPQLKGEYETERNKFISKFAAKYANTQVPGVIKKMNVSPENLKNWSSSTVSKKINEGRLASQREG